MNKSETRAEYIDPKLKARGKDENVFNIRQGVRDNFVGKKIICQIYQILCLKNFLLFH